MEDCEIAFSPMPKTGKVQTDYCSFESLVCWTASEGCSNAFSNSLGADAILIFDRTTKEEIREIFIGFRVHYHHHPALRGRCSICSTDQTTRIRKRSTGDGGTHADECPGQRFSNNCGYDHAL